MLGNKAGAYQSRIPFIFQAFLISRVSPRLYPGKTLSYLSGAYAKRYNQTVHALSGPNVTKSMSLAHFIKQIYI
jgi:hypothetical protein